MDEKRNVETPWITARMRGHDGSCGSRNNIEQLLPTDSPYVYSTLAMRNFLFASLDLKVCHSGANRTTMLQFIHCWWSGSLFVLQLSTLAMELAFDDGIEIPIPLSVYPIPITVLRRLFGHVLTQAGSRKVNPKPRDPLFPTLVGTCRCEFPKVRSQGEMINGREKVWRLT